MKEEQREDLIQSLVKRHGLLLAEIARQVGISTSGVSRILNRRTDLVKPVNKVPYKGPNRRYRTVGNQFQGRYKAILCDRDEYLVELVRYIHLNPEGYEESDAAGAYISSTYCFSIRRALKRGVTDRIASFTILSQRLGTLLVSRS